MTDNMFDVIIIGGGPAGLSAALNSARAKLKTLLIEKATYGGKITLASELANYPGGISSETGKEFAERLSSQADSFGVVKINAEVTEVNFLGYNRQVICGETIYKSKIVMIATGSPPANLGVKGEEKFRGLGISYCATCDAPFFNGSDVFVVGYDDTAIEEAVYLSKFARNVTIISKRKELKADKEVIEKAESIENISFMYNTKVKEFGGIDLLTRIVTENVISNESFTIEAQDGESLGCFLSIEMKPYTNIFESMVEMEDGYVITDEDMRTSMPGIFAIGDVRKKTLRQVVTATADGAIAAFQAEKVINEVDRREEIG